MHRGDTHHGGVALVDENIATIVVARLRTAGHDFVAIAETAAGASDDQVLAIAVADQRILRIRPLVHRSD
ncbi:DUF5615 family PIN-like protein [Reyranella sp.]|uniref:DUF5615 family PIN-like protein n=1 Tax=Reyranella sp. TaxID=1929291 RepID=UPI003D0BEA81